MSDIEEAGEAGKRSFNTEAASATLRVLWTAANVVGLEEVNVVKKTGSTGFDAVASESNNDVACGWAKSVSNRVGSGKTSAGEVVKVRRAAAEMAELVEASHDK